MTRVEPHQYSGQFPADDGQLLASKAGIRVVFYDVEAEHIRLDVRAGAQSGGINQGETTMEAGIGDVAYLRELARQGALVAAATAASPPERTRLTGAAYEIAAPVVYQRLTRRLERGRNHPRCAAAMRGLDEGCLDRFYDDVESVVDHVLTRAAKPIHDLEAWIAGSLTTATVDGYRKRRGRRGAVQRPRVEGSRLAAALRDDPWLTVLANDLLEWVGVTATAGTGTWPLDAWAVRRAEITLDWDSSPATVATEVEQVLAAMRAQPQWYADHVETPLGHKQAPVAPPPPPGREHAALSLVEPDAAAEANLHALAADALALIEARIAQGEEPSVAVVDVVGDVFGAGTGGQELDCAPHTAAPYEERVAALLVDPGTLQRVVAVALSILAECG